MSDTVRTSFAQVPGWVIERVTNPTALRYYMHIAWKHSDGQRHAFPSEAKLAEDLGDRLRTAQRAIKILRDADALIITRNRRKDGHYSGNRYWLPMDDPREHASNMAGADDLPDQPEQRVSTGQNQPPNMAGDHASNMAGQEPDPLKQPHPASNQTPEDQEDQDGSSSSAAPHGTPDQRAEPPDPTDLFDGSVRAGSGLDPGTPEPPSTTAAPRKPAGKGRTGKCAARPDDQTAVRAGKLCEQLKARIVANGCKEPTIGRAWLDAARLLLDRDKRPYQEATWMVDWCQQDDFWRGNVLSMPTFRRKYDQLVLKAKADVERRRNGNVKPWQRRARALAEEQPWRQYVDEIGM